MEFNMRTGTAIAVAISTVLCMGQESRAQESGASQAEALNLISRTATELCGEIQQEGTQNSVSLSGQAEAGLSSLLDSLADIKVSGNADLKNQKFRGVLQEDLAEALADSRACKERVLALLVDRVLPKNAGLGDRSRSQDVEADVASSCRTIGDWPNTSPDEVLIEELEAIESDGAINISNYVRAELLRCLGAAYLVSGQIPDSIRRALPYLDESLVYNPTQSLLREDVRFLSEFLRNNGGDGRKFVETLLQVTRGSRDPDVPILAEQLFDILKEGQN